ncbi:MAG TPA: M56 family metallopeptidase [Bryobacteraceae bacterium]
MIGELANHLWQSTVFAAAVGLFVLAFRNNRAGVRYWLWFSASLKFLLPFMLLIDLGSRINWAPADRPITSQYAAASFPTTLAQIGEPFRDASPRMPAPNPARNWGIPALFAVWSLGSTGVALMRFRGWLRIRSALRASVPLDLPVDIAVRSSPGLLEPGVVGLWRPILLLPAGIAEILSPAQLQAVLAHELCHIRRHDNRWASIHMVVEAVFWFHPAVWWIGARLIEERERACDEEVLSLGGEPRVYAEAIVEVCRRYAGSPLACASGVTGSNLKKRIETIMSNRIVLRLNFGKKAVLAAAGLAALAAPLFVGVMKAPRIRAHSTPAGVVPRFDSVSIQPGCAPSDVDVVLRKSGDGVRKTGARVLSSPGSLPVVLPPGSAPGSLNMNCAPVAGIINAAYGKFASGRPLEEASPLHYVFAVPMSGGPAWLYTDPYHITAKAPGAGQEMMRGPMMQALLEDRFKLKIRRETRNVPAYTLTVAGSSPKMQPFLGDCVSSSIPPPLPPGKIHCWEVPGGERKPAGFTPHFAPDTAVKNMDEFALWLFAITDRPVINQTGLTGRFFVDFTFAPDADTPGALARLAIVARRNGANGAVGAPSNPPGPALWIALQEQLGLKLEATTAPRDFLIIDRAERPAN